MLKRFLDIIEATSIDGLNKGVKVAHKNENVPGKLCCYVHLYYDRFDEIESYIKKTDMKYDFVFSVVKGSPAEAESASLLSFSRKHGRCSIVLVPNSGSDVIPFLLMLHRGVFEGYEFVCKLHGKLTRRHPELGQWWFDTMFRETLVDGLNVLRTALSRGITPSLIGSRSLLISEPAFWTNNERNAQLLGALLGLDLSKLPTPFFFAGTAFWMSRRLLLSLDGLMDYKFRKSDLAYGADGGFGHAFERVVPLKALSSGEIVLDTSGKTYSPGTIVPGIVNDKFRAVFL